MTRPNSFHHVNLWQSKQDRQEKYWLARSLGCNPSWARVLRDWPLVKIERFFNLTPNSLHGKKNPNHVAFAQPLLQLSTTRISLSATAFHSH